MWQSAAFDGHSASYHSFIIYCYKNTLEIFYQFQAILHYRLDPHIWQSRIGRQLSTCGFCFLWGVKLPLKIQVIVEVGRLLISLRARGELWDQLPHLVNAIWLLVSVVNYLCNHATSKPPRVLEVEKKIV